MQDIGDILEGVEDEVVEEVTTEEAEKPEVTEETKEESTAGEEEGSTPEPQEETHEESSSVPRQALIDERRKRQELEAQLREFQAPKEDKPAPDVFEDPQGFTNNIKQMIEATTFETRVTLSQDNMRERFEDYDEKESIFVDMAKENPALAAQMRNSPNPAKFAYETATKAEKLKQMENVDEYESKIRAEIEAKVRAELEQKIKSESEKTSNISPSLAKQSSSGSISGASWTGPTPLNEIFPD